MVQAIIDIDEKANRVLNVVKAKYGLKDKSQAINKFVELYGDAAVEKEANDAYIKRVLEIADKHMKRHGHKKMSVEELDALCEV